MGRFTVRFWPVAAAALTGSLLILGVRADGEGFGIDLL
jgi:hypothetical protein